MADQYEYISSLSDQERKFMFKNKHSIRIPDTNQGVYPSSQVNFNLSSLTTNNHFLSCKQSTIEIPYVIRVSSTQALGTGIQVAHMACLKKSVADLVNGISVQLNENSIINFSDLSNLQTQFKILSTWSQDDLQVKGDGINFAKNDAVSYKYKGAVSTDGIGECNNTMVDVYDPNLGYLQGLESNEGVLQRCYKTSYNVANVEIAKYVSKAQMQTQRKSYLDVVSTTDMYYYIMATIPLNLLHDLFEKMPLVRNPYFKITLQCHTATAVIPYLHTGTTAGITSVSSQYGYNPVMVSKCSDGWVGTADCAVTVTSAIANTGTSASGWGNVCYFNAVLYEFNPDYESRYISEVGNKLVSYHDVFSNTALAQTGAINFQIHTGLARVRALLVVTHLASTVNTLATPATAQGAGTSINMSPFTSGENMLGCSYSNMNVRIGNIPHYAENINYTYDIFQKELLSYNSVNGGLSTGINSGLITRNDFESGVFNYVFVDLSRKAASDDDIPKTINFVATNNSLATALDLHFYVMYESNLVINVHTSSISR